MVQPEGIGRKRVSLHGLAPEPACAHLGVAPGHIVFFNEVGIGTFKIGLAAVHLITGIKDSVCTCAGGIFPLCLGQQAVAVSPAVPAYSLTADNVGRFQPSLPAQVIAVAHSVKPGHVFHRQPCALVTAWVFARHCLIVLLHDFIRIHIEGADSHLVAHFIRCPLPLAPGAPHLKGGARQKEKAVAGRGCLSSMRRASCQKKPQCSKCCGQH